MIFYKVVTKRNKSCRDLTSAIGGHKYVIKYKTQRWRKPVLKGSKIFVFGELKDAKNFLNTNRDDDHDLIIYECKVKNPTKAYRASMIDSYNIELFWSGGTDKVVSYCFIPTGSYYADAVKLTKKVC